MNTFVLALTLLFASSLGQAETKALKFLKSETDKLRVILNDKKPDRNQRFVEYSRNLFDFRELGKRTIPSALDKAGPAERDTYLSKFAELVEATYVHRVEAHLQDYPLTFAEETAKGEDTIVKLITRPKGKDLVIYLSLVKTPKDYRVFNVVYDTVDLLDVYRKQFSRILQKSSLAELIAKIDKKLLTLKKKK